jgi:hypothetical protein
VALLDSTGLQFPVWMLLLRATEIFILEFMCASCRPDGNRQLPRLCIRWCTDQSYGREYVHCSDRCKSARHWWRSRAYPDLE